MDKYKIYCTREQTIKAISLGASIKNVHYDNDGVYIYADNPTAEQMIGWLEDKSFKIMVHFNCFNEFSSIVYHQLAPNGVVYESGWMASRKEATIAAIDAALEYLIKNKEE